jgi:hypothetical protein
VSDAAGERPLRKRLDLFNHSPTGFECGYGGSGPAQLALAILAECLGDDERAVRLHQRYKFRVVGALPRDQHWQLSEADVRSTADDLEAKIRRDRLGLV